jgi:hypothetical protein
MSEDDTSLGRRARPGMRADSDRLLRAVDELRALERERRLQEVSSPPFHALALQVEEKAREVFRLADQDEEQGHAADHGGTIEETRLED